MNRHEETEADCCHDPMVERIRYFTGRHMSAQDFRDADAYHRSLRHLHNRIMHGGGIACGLEVRIHPRADCRSDRVIVRCGMAIDCCGREVVVPRDVVSGRIPWTTKPKTDGSDKEYVLVLCLTYQETLTHKVPVLYSASACSTPELEAGRIREDYELCWRWLLRSDLGKYGWRSAQRCPPPKIDTDAPEQYLRDPQSSAPEMPEPCDDDSRCCLKPDCPPDHCVILALITAAAPEALDKPNDINMSGRRSIAQAREHLTHICWTSWKHGGLMKLSDLDTLKVRFDRVLRKEHQPRRHSGPRGVNASTFSVEYGGGGRDNDLDFVEYRRSPYLDADGRTAVFEVLKDWAVHRLRNQTVQVTIECDFLEDCHGNAVDGDHLGGRLPTGNGVPGGVFRSWFTVVSDDDYGRRDDEYGETGVETVKESRS